MCHAGYPIGILIAPVVLTDDWKTLYSKLFDMMAETLTSKVKKEMVLEIIFMTYSFVHRAINQDAFPNSPNLYDPDYMTGRGRGKYCYKNSVRIEAEDFLVNELNKKLNHPNILYIC